MPKLGDITIRRNYQKEIWAACERCGLSVNCEFIRQGVEMNILVNGKEPSVKVVCSKQEICGNPDCMHYEKHEPTPDEDSDCRGDSFCPLYGWTKCLEVYGLTRTELEIK